MLTPNPKISVVIIDDHAGVRAGIRGLLSIAEDIIITAEGADGIKAIELANTTKPDVMLLDVELPILGGEIAMRRIHDSQPEIRVLVLSAYNDPSYIQTMLANGAAGYITKDEAPALLVEAIRSLHQNGDLWISPNTLINSGLSAPKDQTLTQDEFIILQQVLLGRPRQEILSLLNLDEQQSNDRVHVLMRKFDVDSWDGLRPAVLRGLFRRHTNRPAYNL